MSKVQILLLISFISLPAILWSLSLKNNKKDLDDYSKSFYDYSAISIDGKQIDMSNFKGKKVLIVNVASKCGYTYQYKDLQALNEKYGDYVEILGFPSNDFLFQEPGGNSSIKEFCSVNYGVTFQMFEKIVVKNKASQHPLYVWLSNEKLNGSYDSSPSWNFCKYLIDENGNLIKFFNSKMNPMDPQILHLILPNE